MPLLTTRPAIERARLVAAHLDGLYTISEPAVTTSGPAAVHLLLT